MQGAGKLSTKTFFAPAERASEQTITREHEAVSGEPYVRALLDAQPNIAGVSNTERQFVLVNTSLMELLGMDGIEHVLGQRPGEVLACIHAAEHAGGCGTAESCRYCGAVQAIVESQEGRVRVTKECRITQRVHEELGALDLRVTATPCMMSGEEYTVLSIADIGDEKRRQALERVFFHDVINTATTLYLMLEELEDGGFEADEELPVLKRLSGSILDDVMAQRDLAAAERGDLHVKVETCDALDVLAQVAAELAPLCQAMETEIVIDPSSSDVVLRSDARLLRRTLFNMLKNAIEAEPTGSTVRAGVSTDGVSVLFKVRNDSVMPPDVQSHVFERSFSTKGEGRGLGTYSMKLLGEKYLRGTIRFESSPGGGTTFFARFPLSL